jgi:oxalate decarboxylase
MKEFEKATIDSEPGAVNQVTQGGEVHEPSTEGLLRRNFLRVSPTVLAAAGLAGLTAHAQETKDTRKAEKDTSASDPGPENKPLLDENPSSSMPPPTDHGDIGPVWYSFDLVHKRVQEGGWTHEVNSKVLPSSKDLAGVNMRLTAGSFREFHWHTADEWAIMEYGNARVTVLNPDGTMFIDDVTKGDLWLVPCRFSPFHSGTWARWLPVPASVR